MPAPRNPKTATSQKDLSRRILVSITRDQTAKTPTVIWAHEFALLEAIHGEGNVVLLEPSTLDEGYAPVTSPALMPFNKKQDRASKPSDTAGIGYVFTGSAEGEYNRLATIYGMHPDVKQPWVENVYGRFQSGAFERLLGIAEFEDMPDPQLRALVIDHGYLPAVGRDSTLEERRAIAAQASELNTKGRDELIKLAEELAGALA